MKLYKLTDDTKCSYQDTLWGEGVTHTIRAEQRDTVMCGHGVLHAYRSANLGLLLNPMHSCFFKVLLWEAEGDVVAEDWGKVGCHELTTVKILPLPDWYTDTVKRNRVCIQFAILCARKVLPYYELEYPNDTQPRDVIATVQSGLDGGTTAAAANAAYAAAGRAYAAYAADAANAAYAADALIDFGALADEAVLMVCGET
jgi:hypothetical protein